MTQVDKVHNQSREKADAKICGLILAGGKARRFGADKRFADLGGIPLIQHVMSRLESQVDQLVISSNDTIHGLGHLPHLSDQHEAQGPLLGITQGLTYAFDKGFQWLVTAPADSPFFPQDMADRLISGSKDRKIGFASSGGRTHPVFGAWPTALGKQLRALIAQGERKIDRAAGVLSPVQSIPWMIDSHLGDPFFNINHSEELQQAEHFYAARRALIRPSIQR